MPRRRHKSQRCSLVGTTLWHQLPSDDVMHTFISVTTDTILTLLCECISTSQQDHCRKRLAYALAQFSVLCRSAVETLRQRVEFGGVIFYERTRLKKTRDCFFWDGAPASLHLFCGTKPKNGGETTCSMMERRRAFVKDLESKSQSRITHDVDESPVVPPAFLAKAPTSVVVFMSHLQDTFFFMRLNRTHREFRQCYNEACGRLVYTDSDENRTNMTGLVCNCVSCIHTMAPNSVFGHALAISDRKSANRTSRNCGVFCSEACRRGWHNHRDALVKPLVDSMQDLQKYTTGISPLCNSKGGMRSANDMCTHNSHFQRLAETQWQWAVNLERNRMALQLSITDVKDYLHMLFDTANAILALQYVHEQINRLPGTRRVVRMSGVQFDVKTLEVAVDTVVCNADASLITNLLQSSSTTRTVLRRLCIFGTLNHAR